MPTLLRQHQKTWNNRNRFYCCGFLVLLPIMGFVVWVLIYAILCRPMGWNSHTASIKWYYAMEAGEGAKAIYWANRVKHYEDHGSYTPIELLIATMVKIVYHENYIWTFANLINPYLSMTYN